MLAHLNHDDSVEAIKEALDLKAFLELNLYGWRWRTNRKSSFWWFLNSFGSVEVDDPSNSDDVTPFIIFYWCSISSVYTRRSAGVLWIEKIYQWSILIDNPVLLAWRVALDCAVDSTRQVVDDWWSCQPPNWLRTWILNMRLESEKSTRSDWWLTFGPYGSWAIRSPPKSSWSSQFFQQF